MRITALLIFLSGACHAQYFQFSQYNFTPQRINPAEVASSDYARMSFLFRNQSTGGGYHLNSNIVNASYPLITSKGRRWSGVGVSLMDDRSGPTGIFNTQEAAVSYAISVPTARGQSLSLGLKTLYQRRKIDLDGLYTGLQYVPDRGFSEAMASGENMGLLSSDYFTFSAGLHWQQIDRKGNRLAYWGVSFFDFNRPQDAFIGNDSQLNSTLVASGGFQVYQQGNITVFPELLYTRSASNNVLNAGAVTSYAIKPMPNRMVARVDLITKYVIGRSGIVGLQFHRDNFSFGFSYDFPVFVTNEGNTGAFEAGLEWRRLIDPRKKKNSAAKRKPAATKPVTRTATVKTPADTVASSGKSNAKVPAPTATTNTLSDRLRQKQDSIRAEAQAGNIQHEPLVLEKATLHFNFEFNSVALDDKASEYLDGLAKALQDNPELRIRLVGHTDNVGSEKFNQKLSVYRAEALKEFLVQRGVPADRIAAEGRGMKEALNDNRTDEDRAKNRRVELTILYE